MNHKPSTINHSLKANYRMPAEWEPHEAILLTWPHNPRTWHHGKVESVRKTYMQWIKEIATSEQVWLIVRSPAEEVDVRRRLTLHRVSSQNIRFFHYRNNDAWIRDYGPIVVHDQNKKRTFLDWTFNGWGNKYQETENYRWDDVVPQKLAKDLNLPAMVKDFILEGGSIDINGTGTLITSKSCLLNANRNAEYSLTQIEATLKSYLGIRKIIWVDDGIAGDDTDGHIDDTVRFVNPRTLVCAYEENKEDENHLPLKQAYHSLLTQTDQDGYPLKVVKLPMPEPVYFEGERLPASYANFLITNQKILVPIFQCPQDKIALRILQSCFPKRKVVGINCRDVIIGFGSLHCLSQQIPV